MATAPCSVAELDFSPRHKPFPSPRDWRDCVFYQLLLDRFDDDRDHPPYDPETSQRGRDPAQGHVFQGGRLKGVTRRLDYIKGLGCNAIWISPPFKQRQDDAGSYHGYGIQDFLDIDPRFGTREHLKELVRAAHERGMYVILDIILNHAGDVFRYTQDDAPYRPEGQYEFKHWHKISDGEELTRDDAVWPIELQDPNCFKRKGSIRSFNTNQEEVEDADFFSLKDLDTGNPQVLDTLIACYKYWIAETDVDGYRIDTVRHVESDAMARFCNAIHEYCKRIGKEHFILFGEIVGDDDLLHKYVGSNGPAAGTAEWYPRLDAALDFPLYGVLEDVIKGNKSCGDLRNRYEHFRHFFRSQSEAGRNYITFIDNHDQPYRHGRRFLADADEPDKLGVLGIGYLLCNLGIPCIYYGTEQGFNGKGDSDEHVRETMFGGTWGAFDTQGMHFFNPDHPIYQGIARIAHIRAQHMPLRYGRQYFRDISGDGEHFGCPTDGQCTLAFSRVLDTEEILVALNLDKADRSDWILIDAKLTPPGSTLRDLLSDRTHAVKEIRGGAAVHVPLGGRQMAILVRDTK